MFVNELMRFFQLVPLLPACGNLLGVDFDLTEDAHENVAEKE